ncbi:hypothetical protein MKY34_19645 [Sporosarcina sp. FSL K6-1522]|uniref:hypothetical protein n=1 Tax=Sporosarcina sp. FSL K6-1522 TaxID=2921554 RepID=UPI00315AC190
MRPPMRQNVIAFIPILDAAGKPVTDKYGKEQTTQEQSKARVQFKSQLIRDAKGQERRVALEIDLPTKCNPPVGSKLEYTTVGSQKATGTILAKEEAVNLAGSKVYYRTVYLDG